jgi:putative sigma-54 modulation protein
MQVGLRIRNTDLVNVLRGYTDRRLRFALSRFGDRVGCIVVSISECNGTDRGIAKSCHISAELRPFGQVAARETGPDLYTVIDRAAGRMGRLFASRLGRGKEDEVRRPVLSAGRARGTGRKKKLPSKRMRRSPRARLLQRGWGMNLGDRQKRRTILEFPRHKAAYSRRK